MGATAWAHVTVHPATLPSGSSDVELTFRCPNERDDANTVMLQVFFPTNLPLLTVDVLPVPGWTSTVQTQTLPKPIDTDDGPVSQIVSEVTWKATAGGIAQGQYEDFDVAVGAVPDKAAQLVFKALQTYSSGEIVRWIEVPEAGQPEPDTPAPIVTLTAGSSSTAASTPARESSAAVNGGQSGTDAVSVAALVVASLSLAGVAWVGFVIRRRAQR
ncbi:MAG TPA: YcnI family protein [Acidimicrobiales bacterium]|nr:YcnI family protein [Acidimicrobiales bacterium]